VGRSEAADELAPFSPGKSDGIWYICFRGRSTFNNTPPWAVGCQSEENEESLLFLYSPGFGLLLVSKTDRRMDFVARQMKKLGEILGKLKVRFPSGNLRTFSDVPALLLVTSETTRNKIQAMDKKRGDLCLTEMGNKKSKKTKNKKNTTRKWRARIRDFHDILV
jgi:hypothetical protein